MSDTKTAARVGVCDEEVSRGGMVQPCEKPAVALKHANENGLAYPVCAYHARGDMFTLVEVLAAWKENQQRETRDTRIQKLREAIFAQSQREHRGQIVPELYYPSIAAAETILAAIEGNV